MSIECPNCKTDMQSILYKDTHAKLCMKCKSFFLKSIQLEQILAAEEFDIDGEAPITTQRGSYVVNNCPSCNEVFDKKDFGKILKTTVNVCQSCGGIWLNRGELRRIEYDNGVVRRNTEKNLGTRITCPKCRLIQKPAIQCSGCGFFFNKLRTSTQKNLPHKDTCKSPIERWALQQVERFNVWRGYTDDRVTSTKRFLDALQENRFSHTLIYIASWLLILACAYVVWLLVLNIFSNISSPPPRPTGFDSELSRVSLFYIFGMALAGPILLAITYVLWRLSWYTLYGPIKYLSHRYFHPLIKPAIACALLMLVMQSVSMFANGFWTSYWWLNRQVDLAKFLQIRN